MIWPIRLRGFSEANGSWKTICISRRTGLSFARPAVVMSVPRKLIVPPVGSSRRMSVRDSVVLPQPDSPTRPSVSPSCRCSVTSSTACTCATARSNSSPFLIGKYCLRWSAASRTFGSAAAGRGRAVGAARGGARSGAHIVTPPASSPIWSPIWRSCALRSGTITQRSSWPVPPGTRARSSGLTRQASWACGQRGRKWQPWGAWMSDGGRPVIDGSRSGRGRSTRVIEPEQPPRVRVLRVVEDLVDRALLDDPPGVHDGDPVGDVGDDAEVVRHEDDARRCDSVRSSLRTSRICAWIVTSSAVVGSSAMSTDGSHDSAIAIITRWRMPPENSCG